MDGFENHLQNDTGNIVFSKGYFVGRETLNWILRKLAIYGAGGLGRETALLIQQINAKSHQWDLIGFFDDGLTQGASVDRWKVLGGMRNVLEVSDPIGMVVAIADSAVRNAVVSKMTNTHLHFPSVIHPGCQLGDENNILGDGCILSAGVILTTGIEVGKFVIINLQSTLGHDGRIGDYVTVMPGCSISGNVRIGNGCMIGTGARILQNLSLGNHCKVGAGAVVTDSFGEGKTIIGIPAHEK